MRNFRWWALNAAIAPESSTELSTGIAATVSAPAWVPGAVWGQLYDPNAHYVGESFASPPAQGVKTASGHGVIVPSARGLRFSVNGQGWSWRGSFGNHDVLLQNEAGDSRPFADNLASPIYDCSTIAGGRQPNTGVGGCGKRARQEIASSCEHVLYRHDPSMGESAGSPQRPLPWERTAEAPAVAVGDGDDAPAPGPDIWARVRLVLQYF